MLIPLALFSTTLAIACITLLVVVVVIVDKKEPKETQQIVEKSAPEPPAPIEQPTVAKAKPKPAPPEPAKPTVEKTLPKLNDTKPKIIATNTHHPKTKPRPTTKPKPAQKPAAVQTPAVAKTAQTAPPPSDNDLISDAIGDAVNKLEPKKTPTVKRIPKSGALSRAQALTLQKQAARKLSQRDKVGAFNDCKRAAFYGAQGCYNIIMRSSWDLTDKFTPQEQRACKVLSDLSDKYPADRTSIKIQRSFMKCAKNGM